jgi:hypothetical protein
MLANLWFPCRWWSNPYHLRPISGLVLVDVALDYDGK